MFNLNTAPKKIKALLALCLIGTVFSLGTIFWGYSSTKSVVQTVGRDTVPQIIAARQIKATLANAHTNAMNAMATNEKLGGKFWSLYRKDLNTLHSQLIDSSKNITFGDEERIPLLTILSNISAYEFIGGGAVANGAEISVDQFMEANRLMQQKILPASTALDKANLAQLDSKYGKYIKNSNIVVLIMLIVGFIFLTILIGTQYYLFKQTHRVFNIGLLAATILFSANLIYSTSSLNSIKGDLYTAKHDAFDSLNALWNAKAIAYNAKALESLYLLHNGTGIVQTADTINFNLSAAKLCSDTNNALSSGKFEGYLKDVLNNITFKGEESAATTAVQQWVKYVEIDKQIRNLEYDSKHAEAIALNVGENEGQSNYIFTKFDAALTDIININTTNFEANINSAIKKLNIFPYITTAFLVFIISSCILGMRARIEEYKI